jgi:hypothetical protein
MTFLVCLVLSCAIKKSFPENQYHTIAIPAQNIQIQFPSKNLKVEMEDDNIPYYKYYNKDTGMILSFNFDKASKCGSSERCRDYLSEKLRRLYPDRENWRYKTLEGFYTVENVDLEHNEILLKQLHINANKVVGDVWIDIHISKVAYSEPDRVRFYDFIKSVDIKNYH